MESKRCLNREILDEDLQIVRCTLAAISDDVRRFSDRSADALERAMANLDVARQEFSCTAPRHNHLWPERDDYFPR